MSRLPQAEGTPIAWWFNSDGTPIVAIVPEWLYFSAESLFRQDQLTARHQVVLCSTRCVNIDTWDINVYSTDIGIDKCSTSHHNSRPNFCEGILLGVK